ncbi:MAG: response regulator [Spirochaetes bacterium]|nr:response regulator [Spirochaetota bacterium]
MNDTKMKVLIVDDDTEFVEATATLLETKSYEVIKAYNGEEGFQKAKEEKPDLILLDVMMPGKDGFVLSRDMKAEGLTKKIPVIIITGISKEMNLPYHFEPDNTWLPVNAVLEKPVKPEKLLKTVEDVLQGKVLRDLSEG